MSLEKSIMNLRNRIQNLAQNIQRDGMIHMAKENELRQVLANLNESIGAHKEAQNLLNALEAANKAENASVSPAVGE